MHLALGQPKNWGLFTHSAWPGPALCTASMQSLAQFARSCSSVPGFQPTACSGLPLLWISAVPRVAEQTFTLIFLFGLLLAQ
jgi:hypothetical protein